MKIFEDRLRYSTDFHQGIGKNPCTLAKLIAKAEPPSYLRLTEHRSARSDIEDATIFNELLFGKSSYQKWQEH